MKVLKENNERRIVRYKGKQVNKTGILQANFLWSLQAHKTLSQGQQDFFWNRMVSKECIKIISNITHQSTVFLDYTNNQKDNRCQ